VTRMDSAQMLDIADQIMSKTTAPFDRMRSPMRSCGYLRDCLAGRPSKRLWQRHDPAIKRAVHSAIRLRRPHGSPRVMSDGDVSSADCPNAIETTASVDAGLRVLCDAGPAGFRSPRRDRVYSVPATISGCTAMWRRSSICRRTSATLVASESSSREEVRLRRRIHWRRRDIITATSS